jgi:DNA-binding SARP family transcriptional activator
MSAAVPLEPSEELGRFVGRGGELAELVADLERVPDPRGPVRVVRGAAGVGKTRLAIELAARAQAAGITVAWGHNPDELTAPPHWPWTQVVRSLLGRNRGTDLADLVLDDPATVERFDLFDATTAVVRSAASVAPLLIVLDDLHAADPATLQLTRFLTRHLGDARVLIVATVRDTAGPTPVFEEHLDGLLRHGREVRLSGLSVDAVGELLADHEHAGAVHAVTGGNPLHVHQLVRVLPGPGPTANPMSPDELHDALWRALRARIAAVTGPARAVLDAAAVLGGVFDRRELVTMAEPFDPVAVDHALERLVAEGLVIDGDPGRFGHPLVAEVVRGELTDDDRRRLNRRAASVIDAERIGEVAQHLLRAGPDHAPAAVEALRQAAERAAAAAAHEDAIVHLTQAMEVLDAEVDGSLRLDVLLDLGAAHWRAGQTVAADASYEEAWRQAGLLGDADSLARAALGGGIEYYFADNARPDHLARVESALAMQPEGPSPTEARLLAQLASHHLGPTLSIGQDLARRAVAMARSFDDPLALGTALIARQVADLGPGTLARRIADGHEILDCARRADDDRLTVHGRFLLMVALLEAGDIRGLDGELLRHDDVTEDLGEPRFNRFALWLRATRAMLEGDVPAAERLTEQTFEISAALGDPDAFGVYGGQHGVLLWMQGRVQETAPVYAAMRAAEPHEPLWPSVLAWLAMLDGRVEEARGLLETVPDPASLPGGMHWLLTAVTYAEVAAAVGTDVQVATAWNALVPFADHVVPVAMGAAVWGTVANPLGQLALRQGRIEEGIAYLRTAMRTCARLGARPWLIQAQLDLADALAEHAADRPDVLLEAAGLRSEALTSARRHDLGLFLDRATTSARVSGVRQETTTGIVGPGPTATSSNEVVPSVRVIGGFEVVGRSGGTAAWSSRKARELLKILVARRGAPIAREELMGLLWPDEDPSALANRLSVALSTVRRALDPERSLPPGDLISTAVDAVALNLSVVRVDVEHLLEQARSVLTAGRTAAGPPDPRAADRAAALLDTHRGEALPDVPHAEWAAGVRSEVRVALRALAELVAEDAERREDHLRAVDAHRRVLDTDPYDESAGLGLAIAFNRMGAHGQAEAAYASYAARMAELHVSAAERPWGDGGDAAPARMTP